VRKVKIALLLYVCFFLFYSATPYERLVIPPADKLIKYDLLPKEPERAIEPPRRNVPEEYRELFADAADCAGIPPGALESIAWAESKFCAEAKSPEREDENRDLGMFQFNSKYLDWYAGQYNRGIPLDPMIPAEAIGIAAKHIRFLYDRYGKWGDVLIAYNAGYGAVDREEIPESAIQYLLRIFEGKKSNGNL